MVLEYSKICYSSWEAKGYSLIPRLTSNKGKVFTFASNKINAEESLGSQLRLAYSLKVSL